MERVAEVAGYLRGARIIDAPTAFEIRQGELMGRPSLLRITVPEPCLQTLKVMGDEIDANV